MFNSFYLYLSISIFYSSILSTVLSNAYLSHSSCSFLYSLYLYYSNVTDQSKQIFSLLDPYIVTFSLTLVQQLLLLPWTPPNSASTSASTPSTSTSPSPSQPSTIFSLGNNTNKISFDVMNYYPTNQLVDFLFQALGGPVFFDKIFSLLLTTFSQVISFFHMIISLFDQSFDSFVLRYRSFLSFFDLQSNSILM